ncbi:MAG: hypothetical protein HY815_07385 [Candidatus Riflebacteria bacterium]|nr:hypothetical protein [Candidatus Riflebacteria bacterium]
MIRIVTTLGCLLAVATTAATACSKGSGDWAAAHKCLDLRKVLARGIASWESEQKRTFLDGRVCRIGPADLAALRRTNHLEGLPALAFAQPRCLDDWILLPHGRGVGCLTHGVENLTDPVREQFVRAGVADGAILKATSSEPPIEPYPVCIEEVVANIFLALVVLLVSVTRHGFQEAGSEGRAALYSCVVTVVSFVVPPLRPVVFGIFYVLGLLLVYAVLACISELLHGLFRGASHVLSPEIKVKDEP